MSVVKLPLARRLQLLQDNRHAHPEYVESVILRVAKMKITDYMADLDKELDQLQAALDLMPEQIQAMTYQDAAALIVELLRYKTTRQRAAQALDMLAAPLLLECQLYGTQEVS